ncbi:alpha/beta hydrolase [Moritella marina]|uniref:alpha/beta hydrolase n=1 Tax=Moritella marina TaxID=90736 RepID=UPI003703915A
MQTVFLTVIYFVVIPVVIQLSIAALLIMFGKRKPRNSDNNSLNFDELYTVDYTCLPPRQSCKARDGKEITYRHYPASADTVLILLHGSGWHSQYLLPLAKSISDDGLASVYTLDLRGHGLTPERRGDVDYIEQLEDDLADFITQIQARHPNAKLILGGHSSGGGLAIRFAGSHYADQIDAYLLLSPFLKYNAPTMRSNSGGWAHVHTARIIGLSMLNMLGIHRFDHLTAIEFNMPASARDGTETLSYSHRLNTAYAPRHYKKDLAAIKQPVLVAVGECDDAFIAQQFESVMSPYTSVKVALLPEVSHMGIVVGSEIRLVVKAWLQKLNSNTF